MLENIIHYIHNEMGGQELWRALCFKELCLKYIFWGGGAVREGGKQRGISFGFCTTMHHMNEKF